MFRLQYYETDRQFLKRRSSKNADVLITDDSEYKPQFWFGITQREIIDIKDFHYTIKRDLSNCMIAEENYCEDLNGNDFITYEV